MQVAAFARLTGDEDAARRSAARASRPSSCPNQIAPDGSFPQELRRTKPYGYSLFNLDAMADDLPRSLSTPADNLWTFELADGRGVRQALAFMAPFIARQEDAGRCQPDVDVRRRMADAPVEPPLRRRRPAGGPTTCELWQTLPADSTVDEVIRNFFVRQPVLCD